MQGLRYLFYVLMLLFFSCVDKEAASCPKILSYIQDNLPTFGTLQEIDGFVFVDIDDEYIHKLVAFIQENGFEEPPYFGKADLVGAHITVIYPEEVKKFGIGQIQERGETVYFTPINCKVVHPPNWKEVDEVYLITVESPKLDWIRKKYGLPRQRYAFHITIGVKPKAA